MYRQNKGVRGGVHGARWRASRRGAGGNKQAAMHLLPTYLFVDACVIIELGFFENIRLFCVMKVFRIKNNGGQR